MSKSRSATPKPKPNTSPSINISPSTESTTSRPRIHECPPSGHYFGGCGQQLRSRPVSPHSFRRPPPEASSHESPSLVRSADPPVEQPMSKRLRRVSQQRRQSSASPSSDSQDGMADTETDTSRNQQSEVPQPPVKPQPKKKRTRTLTTPHQSAVLHALLAQSRFPTTAMREEVGRSIGLSARKVQIWFQNQRQKARRPHSQIDASHPPQYGPFPTGSDSTVTSSLNTIPDQGTSSGTTQLSHARVRGFEEDHPTYSGHQSAGSLTGSLNSPSQLSGPGVPGSEYRNYQEPPGSASAPIQRPDPSSSITRPYTNPSPSLSTPYSIPTSRPITAGRLPDREFSRTLPPLNFGSVQSQGSSATRPHGMHSPLPLYHPSRPSTPEPSFAHQPPESFSRSLILPPPYTLQPAPQWDNSFPTPLRLELLGGSRTYATSESIPSTPLPICTERLDAEMIIRPSHVGAARPSRSSRYDPVRATFIPTTSTSPPPSPAHETGGSSDLGDGRNP